MFCADVAFLSQPVDAKKTTCGYPQRLDKLKAVDMQNVRYQLRGGRGGEPRISPALNKRWQIF
jgi:hypothetical protein